MRCTLPEARSREGAPQWLYLAREMKQTEMSPG